MQEINALQPFFEYGIFAVLFVYLLLYILKASREDKEKIQQENSKREDRLIEESKKREEKLYHVIEQITNKFDMLNGKIDELGSKIGRKKQDGDN